jgi:hypothetical protein
MKREEWSNPSMPTTRRPWGTSATCLLFSEPRHISIWPNIRRRWKKRKRLTSSSTSIQIRILGTLGLAYALNEEAKQALQMIDLLDRLKIVNPVMKASRNFTAAKIYVALNDFQKALEAIRQSDPTAHVLLSDSFYAP